MEESTRQNLIMAFNNVLRTSALVGVVDFQRAALAFGTLLQESSDGVVELGPLYDFLIQHGGQEQDLAVVEVILFMKSREARFGVAMRLPRRLAELTEEQKDTIVLNFTSRGAQSGTRAGQGLAPGDSPTSSTRVPPSADPARPSPTDFGKQSDDDDESAGRTRKLAITAGLLAVVAVVVFAVQEATKSPPPTKLKITDSAALPCLDPVFGAGDAVICRVPLAFFKAEGKEAIEARSQLTKAAVLARGYRRILLYTHEDNRLQKVYSW